MSIAPAPILLLTLNIANPHPLIGITGDLECGGLTPLSLVVARHHL